MIIVKPEGGQLNLSLGTKWPCHCKETGTRPRHRLVDRSNVASCAMMNDQISVSGKYLSSIYDIVVRPLSILISEDIFAYNDLYFIVLSLFRFPLWVICSFCCLDCNNCFICI